VRTTTELGYPAVTGDNWQGIVVPAGTPKDIVDILHQQMVAAINAADMKERLATLGFEPVAGTPEAFAQHIRTEAEKWAKVTREADIREK
jgi:tripartite-type tricarboxylate transporter receptor subunit TctC